MLETTHARARQKRLLTRLAAENLDAIVIGLPIHVYYLSTHRSFWLHAAALLIDRNGRVTLISANQPDPRAAADETAAYEAQWFSTHRQEQPSVIAADLVRRLRELGAKRIGIDACAIGSQVALQFAGQCVAIDPHLWQMRRQKDPDELALMRRAIACADAMYRRAREIIEPGVSELRVFTELHATAVEVAGEPMSDLLGNDYACGVPGGPPRGGYTAKAGQIYILDLGPVVAGYFSDTARGIAVDGKPTDAQLKSWTAIAGVFPIIEKLARPGVRCRDITDAVDAHLLETTGSKMGHHLGHGVGLQPHEYPHLNPMWDDTLLEGEVFTCEPGRYGPELGGGIRLENQYRVTASGVENLTPFPLDLA